MKIIDYSEFMCSINVEDGVHMGLINNIYEIYIQNWVAFEEFKTFS